MRCIETYPVAVYLYIGHIDKQQHEMYGNFITKCIQCAQLTDKQQRADENAPQDFVCPKKIPNYRKEI